MAQRLAVRDTSGRNCLKWYLTRTPAFYVQRRIKMGDQLVFGGQHLDRWGDVLVRLGRGYLRKRILHIAQYIKCHVTYNIKRPSDSWVFTSICASAHTSVYPARRGQRDSSDVAATTIGRSHTGVNGAGRSQ